MDTFSLLTVLVSEYAPEGLAYLSQHLLGVSALCEDVTEAIQALTYRLCTVIGEKVLLKKHEGHSSELCSLHYLQKYILDYFQWLRSHKGPLVKLSRVAEVVHCVHPSLRYSSRMRPDSPSCSSPRFSLQNETYQSSQDIVLKYNEKYRDHLTLVHLPQQTFRRDDVRQVTTFS
jgi:hypothetical protein